MWTGLFLSFLTLEYPVARNGTVIIGIFQQQREFPGEGLTQCRGDRLNATVIGKIIHRYFIGNKSNSSDNDRSIGHRIPLAPPDHAENRSETEVRGSARGLTGRRQDCLSNQRAFLCLSGAYLVPIWCLSGDVVRWALLVAQDRMGCGDGVDRLPRLA
jgi:hypothetical protein